MSAKNPIPIAVERSGKICPVCGKPSYSRDGVHPQCSMVLADAPRKLRLAAEKKAKAKEGQ
jgi:predicted amidophosphoribosyltransferase